MSFIPHPVWRWKLVTLNSARNSKSSHGNIDPRLPIAEAALRPWYRSYGIVTCNSAGRKDLRITLLALLFVDYSLKITGCNVILQFGNKGYFTIRW